MSDEKKPPKVDEATAIAELSKMAAAAGKDDTDLLGLLPLVQDARLFLSGGKVNYRLAQPVVLANSQKLDKVELRFPTQDDYDVYSKGLSIKTDRSGAVTVEASMMADLSRRVIERLTAGAEPGDVSPWDGVLGRMTRADFRAVSEVCDALGFFE